MIEQGHFINSKLQLKRKFPTSKKLVIKQSPSKWDIICHVWPFKNLWWPSQLWRLEYISPSKITNSSVFYNSVLLRLVSVSFSMALFVFRNNWEKKFSLLNSGKNPGISILRGEAIWFYLKRCPSRIKIDVLEVFRHEFIPSVSFSMAQSLHNMSLMLLIIFSK